VVTRAWRTIGDAGGRTLAGDRSNDMAKYMVIANYEAEGIKGVLKTGGTARSDAVSKMVADMGGSVESFHYAFGTDDCYVVVDMPGNESAAAVSMAVSSTGLVGCRIVVLLTPSEIDAAAQMHVDYVAPGK
jgi:uncharacterized protein with GYD domain